MTVSSKTLGSGASEKEAIGGAKEGDHKCFEFLYALHHRRVYNLCFRMTGDVHQAEDLTQEAFLQLHRRISTFRGESRFSTWLHRLTVNVVLMHVRKNGIREVSLDGTLESTEDDALRTDVVYQDQVLAGSIDRVGLERAIQSLAPGYRMVFVLHDIEGYEHNEIAEMLGCSMGNSKSQLHKARISLRNLLKGMPCEKSRSKLSQGKGSSPASYEPHLQIRVHSRTGTSDDIDAEESWQLS